VRILPFSSESDVENDLAEIDLLYLPLPFGVENEFFVRFSLSTKMVTYLASGIPILFHGPKNSAACALLSEADAALNFNSLDAELLAQLLSKTLQTPKALESFVEKSLALARWRFRLEDQQKRFWSAIPA